MNVSDIVAIIAVVLSAGSVVVAVLALRQTHRAIPTPLLIAEWDWNSEPWFEDEDTEDLIGVSLRNFSEASAFDVRIFATGFGEPDLVWPFHSKPVLRSDDAIRFRLPRYSHPSWVENDRGGESWHRTALSVDELPSFTVKWRQSPDRRVLREMTISPMDADDDVLANT